jgi:hypothetical protein
MNIGMRLVRAEARGAWLRRVAALACAGGALADEPRPAETNRTVLLDARVRALQTMTGSPITESFLWYARTAPERSGRLYALAAEVAAALHEGRAAGRRPG